MPQKLLTDLPPDVVQHIVVRIALAHHIGRAAPTCSVVSVAARNALKVRQFSGEVAVLVGHEVSCVAVAPDGRIVTGSDDCTIKVWHDGVCERSIQAHADNSDHRAPPTVSGTAVLPCGTRFVSTSGDDTTKLWTLDGALERTFEMDSAGGYVWCIAALPDGVHFVVGLGEGNRDGEVRLYHVDGTLVHAFACSGTVDTVAVSPDGQHIISCSSEIEVWSVATKSLLSTCIGAVAVAAPDGQRLLSGGLDGTVRVGLLDGTHENTFKLQDSGVRALAALPDNQHALSGSHDIKLFNVNDGAVLHTFKHRGGPVRCLALLPDGLRFVSRSLDATVRIAYHGLAA